MIELKEIETKQLLDYLGSKPLVESYDLFNMIVNKITESKENNEVKEAKKEVIDVNK